jgi:hypothetical protein
VKFLRFFRFLGNIIPKNVRETYEFSAESAIELGRSFEEGRVEICFGTHLVSLKFWKMELGRVFGVLFISIL